MKRIQIVSLQMVKEKSLMVEYPNPLSSPEDVAKVISTLIGQKDREHLVTLCLNTKNKISCVEIASIGSLNASVVHPREVFKVAILANAASIIIGHNHPSGNCTASQEDINITRRLAQTGQLVGIELLDHLIVNYDGEYISLKEKGIL